MRIEFFFFFLEINESALDSVDVTVCNMQNSISLILKFRKLEWIEYIDNDVFTALIYLGFYLEQIVNKCIWMFSKVYCF